MIAVNRPPSSRTERTNPLAIAALVCGIVLFPFGIFAIILGHMASREIRRTGEHGRSLATAGLILGYIGIAPLIFTLALMMSGDLPGSLWKILIIPDVAILLRLRGPGNHDDLGPG
jgi:hypothetical protein